jgi:hypothetical protein
MVRAGLGVGGRPVELGGSMVGTAPDLVSGRGRGTAERWPAAWGRAFPTDASGAPWLWIQDRFIARNRQLEQLHFTRDLFEAARAPVLPMFRGNSSAKAGAMAISVPAQVVGAPPWERRHPCRRGVNAPPSAITVELRNELGQAVAFPPPRPPGRECAERKFALGTSEPYPCSRTGVRLSLTSSGPAFPGGVC